MAASRFFGKPLVTHIVAQQRRTAHHMATLAAAEHGALQANFAVAGGNGAGVAMVEVSSQSAMVADVLVVIQSLL